MAWSWADVRNQRGRRMALEVAMIDRPGPCPALCGAQNMGPRIDPVNRRRARETTTAKPPPLMPTVDAMTAPLLRRISGLALAAAIAACSPMVDTRGNMPPPEIVSTIQPGVTTRTQVSQLLGSPSSVATFNDRTWYYIGRKTETVAFMSPELT